MKYILMLTASLFFFLNGACKPEKKYTKKIVAQTDARLPAKKLLNVSYGTTTDQIYDVYLPENRSANKTKVVLFIHGGGWTSGDKSDVLGLIKSLQQTMPDVAFINMNYRLSRLVDQPIFPYAIDDVETVINEVVSKNKEYGISKDIAIMGVSAGAQLGALYAYGRNTNNYIKAYVNMVGPTDFSQLFYFNDIESQLMLKQLVDEEQFSKDQNPTVELSPVTHITKNSVPTLNLYGKDDLLVPIEQLSVLERALNKYNVPYESKIYPGGHGNWDKVAYADLQKRVTSFLTAHLLNQKT